MKKYLIIIICISITFTSCSIDTMSKEITGDKFEDNLEVQEFDVAKYIETIEDLLADLNYIRIDSIFLESKETNPDFDEELIMDNILTIFNAYSDSRSTYELINFLDIHVKSLSLLDLDILLLKIVQRIESDYSKYKEIILDERFRFISQNYSNRITTTFLENYEISEEALESYPDIKSFLNELNRIVNGGYQIRKFNNFYHIFPDYASILVRYDDYYSSEANLFVDILVRESRNVVKAGNIIQVDNEEIAYKINQLESFLKQYPNSMYFDKVYNIYIDYFDILVSNYNNMESLTLYTKKYNSVAIADFYEIISRYGNTEMARILSEFIYSIDEDNGIYYEDTLNEIKQKIISSY